MIASANEVAVFKSGDQETKTLIKEEPPLTHGFQSQLCRTAFSYNSSDNSLLCYMAVSLSAQPDTYEPRSEKTGLRGFRPGPTQTGLYSHRI